ncbi:MAG: phosphatase, partial [bacterium]
KGIEIFCSKLDEQTAGYFQHMAKENNLLITGGSDCHGKILSRDILMGTIEIPYSILEELKKAKQTLFP